MRGPPPARPGDCERTFTKDDLLTHATIYWVNNSIATSMRYYANANRYPWMPAHDRTPIVQVPVGLTFVTYENPPGIHTADEHVHTFKTGPQANWFNHVNVDPTVTTMAATSSPGRTPTPG